MNIKIDIKYTPDRKKPSKPSVIDIRNEIAKILKFKPSGMNMSNEPWYDTWSKQYDINVLDAVRKLVKKS